MVVCRCRPLKVPNRVVEFVAVPMVDLMSFGGRPQESLGDKSVNTMRVAAGLLVIATKPDLRITTGL